MFRFFRRKRVPNTVPQYLEIAAAILRARGKCSGRMWDEHGRVDVLGALRLATLGAIETEEVSKVLARRHAWKFWQAYQMCKEAIADDVMKTDAYVIDMPEDLKEPPGQSVLLQKWSDNYTTWAVAETLERISRKPLRTLALDEIN